MIVIGPFGLLVILALAFRAARMVVGWMMFAVMCLVVYACTVHSGP